MKKLFAFVVILSLVGFVSCEQSAIPVTSVSLNSSSLTLKEGETATLSASVQPTDATNKNVTWSSGNEQVVMVKNGVVTAVKQGSTKITVKTEDGGKTATCSVVVEPKYVAVSGITLDKTTLSIYDDEEITLTATIVPENATEKSVTWKSSDESVASVSGGKVTAHKEGSTDITASIENASAKCVVTVNKRIIHVESVSLSAEHKRLKVGETFTIDCTVYPSNANDYELTYSSKDESIASVSSDGVITAVNSGKTTIIVSAEDKSSEFSVSVFKSDDVYCYIVENSYDPNTGLYTKYSTSMYKNGELQNEYPDLYVDRVFFEEESPIIIATEHHGYNIQSVVIQNGVSRYLNEPSGIANRILIIRSCYVNKKLYHLVNYPLPILNGGFGIWEDFDKKYDITENGRLSEYSTFKVNDMTVVGDDVYTCGYIEEPYDEYHTHYVPIIWKNGYIYKAFESEIGGELDSIEHINGKLFVTMSKDIAISPKEAVSYVSIMDENGKCYDFGQTTLYHTAQLRWLDSKLYAFFEDEMWRVYEDGTVKYEMKNLGAGLTWSWLDGDFYGVQIKAEKWGGKDYYSAYLYRNNDEETVLVPSQSNILYCPIVSAFTRE